MSFNPRPSLLTGESAKARKHMIGIVMFQSTPVIADGRIPRSPEKAWSPSCFNPRPSLLTGESFYLQHHAFGGKVFQSTPVIADGRISGSRASPLRLSRSFNPRPSLLTGES